MTYLHNEIGANKIKCPGPSTCLNTLNGIFSIHSLNKHFLINDSLAQNTSKANIISRIMCDRERGKVNNPKNKESENVCL